MMGHHQSKQNSKNPNGLSWKRWRVATSYGRAIAHPTFHNLIQTTISPYLIPFPWLISQLIPTLISLHTSFFSLVEWDYSSQSNFQPGCLLGFFDDFSLSLQLIPIQLQQQQQKQTLHNHIFSIFHLQYIFIGCKSKNLGHDHPMKGSFNFLCGLNVYLTILWVLLPEMLHAFSSSLSLSTS